MQKRAKAEVPILGCLLGSEESAQRQGMWNNGISIEFPRGVSFGKFGTSQRNAGEERVCEL